MTFEGDYLIDLAEIGRHIASENGEKVGDPREYAIDYLGSRYVARHSKDFDQKDNGVLIFIGGDSTKIGLPDDYDDDSDEQEDDGDSKVTFSMEDGPPSTA